MELASFRYVDGAWSQPFPSLDSDRTMIIAFAAPSYGARGEVLAELAAAYPSSAMIGCSTSGEIDQTRIRDDSITVAAVRFAHTRTRACVELVRGSSRRPIRSRPASRSRPRCERTICER
jgi:hypothetical protein